MCTDRPEEDAAEHHGANRMSTITVLKLIGEIVKAAGEKQSDLLKKVKLIEASRNMTSR